MLSPRDFSNPADEREDIAAGWFALGRSGDMSETDAATLEQWLAADPRNRAAFDACGQMWTNVETMRAHPRMLALREKALDGGAKGQSTLIVRAAAVAIVVAGVGGVWAAATGNLSELFSRTILQEFRTTVGQRATVTLPDGSVVTLDTDTVLRSSETAHRRRIELEHGRAFFKVAKDASRPFIVSAGGRTVRATGTEFDVRLEPDRFEVTLVEGRVRVEAPVAQEAGGVGTQVAELAPGTRLIADSDDWRLTRISIDRATSWLDGQLVYEHEPLGDVVKEINRYSRRKIVITDQRLAAEPVAGTFPAGDAESFVRAVGVARIAKVARETDETIELEWR